MAAKSIFTYMPDEAHKTVSAIAINALPKTEYIQGEPLSTVGGSIKVDYNNMTSDIIDLSQAEIIGFDTEKVGNQVLVVTYYDKKTTYEVNVVVENAGTIEIRIVDMSGRTVKTVKPTADRTEIPMQKTGIYLVKTATKTQKVIIK